MQAKLLHRGGLFTPHLFLTLWARYSAQIGAHDAYIRHIYILDIGILMDEKASKHSRGDIPSENA